MSEKTLLVDELISQIREGKYKPNDKLPSENELADLYKVPRMVIRKAYERLQELGFIFSKQGKGSYVQNRRLQIPLILTGNVSFTEKMREMNYDYKTKTISCEEIPYDSSIYHTLNANRGEVVYKISRLRIVEECPIAVHTSFLPQSLFQNIQMEGKDIRSIFQFYKQKGYSDFQSMKSQLSVVFPSEAERETLECPSLVPLLLLESGCADGKTGTVLECSQIMYRSDCFTYVL